MSVGQQSLSKCCNKNWWCIGDASLSRVIRLEHNHFINQEKWFEKELPIPTTIYGPVEQYFFFSQYPQLSLILKLAWKEHIYEENLCIDDQEKHLHWWCKIPQVDSLCLQCRCSKHPFHFACWRVWKTFGSWPRKSARFNTCQSSESKEDAFCLRGSMVRFETWKPNDKHLILQGLDHPALVLGIYGRVYHIIGFGWI